MCVLFPDNARSLVGELAVMDDGNGLWDGTPGQGIGRGREGREIWRDMGRDMFIYGCMPMSVIGSFT